MYLCFTLMGKLSYSIITGITAYRIVAAPVLLILIFTGNERLFAWLLPVSFFTDLIDGYLARKYKVNSVFGARLDSIGDDLTMLAGIAGLFVFKMEFLKDHWVSVGILLALFLIQTVSALIRYGKISSFHTYLAKTAAIFQGMFLILLFILPDPLPILFYAAAALTMLDLIEEIVLVVLLPQWKVNIKGLYWVLKERSLTTNTKA